VFLGADEHQRYFRGWEFVLHELGVPYTIIGDADLNPQRLTQFSVLILSNITSLSEASSEAIFRWTIGGGRLLATFGTGYKGVTVDRREAERLAQQGGAPFALHKLWHDPVEVVYASEAVYSSVDVFLSRYAGPTAGLRTLPGSLLRYGGSANLLLRRPPHMRDVLGWVYSDNAVTSHPAIISTVSNRGHTVYYAFAPEYIVSKEFEGTALMPDLPVCSDGCNWTGRSEQLRVLMRDTVRFLLALPRATTSPLRQR
jgi:hypothetical protein